MWLELNEQGARGRGGGEERAGRGQGRAFGTVREFGITRCCRRIVQWSSSCAESIRASVTCHVASCPTVSSSEPQQTRSPTVCGICAWSPGASRSALS